MADLSLNKAGIAREFLPFFRIYKDGRVESLVGTERVPPSTDPVTGVTSKDVVVTPSSCAWVRLYLPKQDDDLKMKLLVLVYFHGGGFCVESAANPNYHNYLNNLAAKANIIAVSVEYRLAPEYPLPLAYEDSWNALQWVASHSTGYGSDAWLNDYGDFDHIFIAGDSAGGNITHHMALRVTNHHQISKIKIEGAILIHPYFWGNERIGSESNMDYGIVEELWKYACPSDSQGGSNLDNPWLNPFVQEAPPLKELGVERVLILVAEEDWFRDRGWLYYEQPRKSGWRGKKVEIDEAKGEHHTFHLDNPDSENAIKLMEKVIAFISNKTVN
ncbi:hypothetical protein Ancab_031941 [Ancistrocladus abbreviatus]